MFFMIDAFCFIAVTCIFVTTAKCINVLRFLTTGALQLVYRKPLMAASVFQTT